MGILDDIWNGIEGVANIATGGIYGAVDNAWTKWTDTGNGGTGNVLGDVGKLIAQPGVGAGLNLVGGVLQGNSAMDMQRLANEVNIEQARLNREFQSEGQKKEFNFNSEQAEKNRLFQSAEAVKAREYETMMSNSAYQRATADMKKAGINPMLAFMQGGATTPNVGAPSGSTASGGGVSGSQAHVAPATAAAEIISRSLANSISTAQEARRINNEVRMTSKNLEEKNQNIRLLSEMVNTQKAKTLTESNSARKIDQEVRNLGLQEIGLKYSLPKLRNTAKAQMDIESGWDKGRSYYFLKNLFDVLPFSSAASMKL